LLQQNHTAGPPARSAWKKRVDHLRVKQRHCKPRQKMMVKTLIFFVITDTERKLFAVLFGPIVDKILSEPD